MCGIVGFSGSYGAEMLTRMNAAIAHRGPDGRGQYHDPNAQVGMAHQRLAIIDTSDAGLQPMWDAGRRAVITFNGEIYNYGELRAELLKDGVRLTSRTDTEVLLQLYLRDGPACL